MKLVFLIDPVPAARPRVGRWSTYYPKTYESFKEAMAKMILKVPKTLIEEPIRTEITFYKGIPKSFSNKKRVSMDGQWCLSHAAGDLDNLEKSIYDALNEHVYVDDCQIVEHTTRKKWTLENPRIEVLLTIISHENP